MLCHLDLPWLPAGLEQRVGRAARPGAVRGWVQTYIPYIRDAGIAHIVSILSPRGGEHHQVLDSYEGVAAADSTVATQLGQITGEIAEHKDARRLRRDRGQAARRGERVRRRLTRLRINVYQEVRNLWQPTLITRREAADSAARARPRSKRPSTLA